MGFKTGVAAAFLAAAHLASAQQASAPQHGMPTPDKDGNVSFIASDSAYSVYGNCRKPHAHVTVLGLNADGKHDHFFVGTNAFSITVAQVKLGDQTYTIGDFCKDDGSLDTATAERAFESISKLQHRFSRVTRTETSAYLLHLH